jgi:hypothetical protein
MSGMSGIRIFLATECVKEKEYLNDYEFTGVADF